jgi:hypothetical protein
MLVAVQGLPSAMPAGVAYQVINLILVISYMSVFAKKLPQAEEAASEAVPAGA